MKNKLLLLILLFSLENSQAQNVGIGTPSPTTTLDVKGGFMVQPRLIPLTASFITIPDNESNILLQAGYAGDYSIVMAAAQPGQRLIVDNQTGYIGAIEQDEIIEKGMNEYIYSLGKWKIANTNIAWGLTGNAGTTESNYIGTRDAQPIQFRTHGNRNAGLLDNVKNTYHIGGGLPFASSYTGSRNVSLGSLSSTNLEAGSNNISLGFYSLFSNKTGDDNVAIGTWALRFNKTGRGNVAIGQYASSRDTSARGNVAIGAQALQFNVSRSGNTAIGSSALQYNTDTSPLGSTQGEFNTAIGTYALNKNLRGSGAVAVGAYAAFSDTGAEGIVAIGRAALFNNNGGNSHVAIGDSALFYNGFGLSMGDLFYPFGNTAVGSKTLLKNTTGGANTGIGALVLNNNLSGDRNTAIGGRSAMETISGYNNTSVGYGSLDLNQLSAGNVAIGYASLSGFNPNEVIGENVAVGAAALNKLRQGYENVSIGANSMGDKIQGFRNNALGNEAGKENISGSGNVFLGNQAGALSKGFNKLYIENTNADSLNTLIYGDFQADSLLLNAKTVVRNNAVVRGFTKLGGYGTDVPSIKMKKISIPVGPATNAFQGYPLGSGITDSKVVGIQVLLNYAGTWKMPPSYIDAAGYEYNVQIQNNNIVIILKNGNSANIGGKPISII